MIRTALFAFALLAAPAAFAQTPETAAPPSTFSEFAAETYSADLPGLRDGQRRRIYFWAPREAHVPLPVLYVADGLAGMEMVLTHLRRPMLDGRIRPILIVGLEASSNHRTAEYALGSRRNPDFERHHDWFINTVVPWVEENAGASRDPAERGLGGFSNGADWALATAARHPDMFGVVLAHSPVNRLRVDITDQTQGRWVLTASRLELQGEVSSITNDVARSLQGRPVRHCVGTWRHDGPSWIEVTPGAVTWLYQLGDVASMETDTERQYCRLR